MSGEGMASSSLGPQVLCPCKQLPKGVVGSRGTLKNFYDTVHPQVFAECLPCSCKPRAMVGCAPQAGALGIRVFSQSWGVPYSPPGP